MPLDDGIDDISPAMVRPENKIRDKVTLGGRITGDGFDPELLARAEAAAEGTRDSFLEAADEDMDKLQNACRLAENEPQTRVTHLRSLQRTAHEIKGYGSNIGYDLLTLFADSLSNFLLKSSAAESQQVSVARVHVDAMRLVFYQQITGDGGGVGKLLMQRLRDAVAKVSRPPSAPVQF